MKNLLANGLIAAALAVPAAASGHALAIPQDNPRAPQPAPTTVQHPDWTRNAVIYEVNWRQMTPEGTIAAVEQQIPRLKDLGVDILWVMPVNPISKEGRKGELGSYYASADYKALNPEMGTMADFRHFVKAAHDAGMKVIIDWVPNHTGNDNWWRTYHPDFYRYDDKGNVIHPADWTDVSQLDYSNPEMRRYMIDAMAHWIYDADIDGFRCDVAGMVPVDFWNEARPQLEAIKPGLFMLAEADNAPLLEHAFDMDYNWPMANLFKEIANNAGQYSRPGADRMARRPAVAIDTLLAHQAATYPADGYMMNMITNHDFNSWEGTEFERFGNLADAMAVLSYTLPGMPLIYTGQETGLNRAFEFFKKDTAPDFEPRNSYFDFYRSLNELKHREPALRAGAPGKGGHMLRYPATSPDLYIFERQMGDSRVLVMVNLGSKTRKIKYTGSTPSPQWMVNWFTREDGKLPKSLKPGEYRVYVRRTPPLNKPM